MGPREGGMSTLEVAAAAAAAANAASGENLMEG